MAADQKTTLRLRLETVARALAAKRTPEAADQRWPEFIEDAMLVLAALDARGREATTGERVARVGRALWGINDLANVPFGEIARTIVAALASDFADAREAEQRERAAEVARLREALAPFARFSEYYPGTRDDLVVTSLQDPRCFITGADLHCARAALAAAPGPGGEVGE